MSSARGTSDTVRPETPAKEPILSRVSPASGADLPETFRMVAASRSAGSDVGTAESHGIREDRRSRSGGGAMSDVALSTSSWAERITAAWQSSLEGILAAGRLLAEAKAALPHGEFICMIEAELPFKASTAQRLMKIAADKRISNTANVQHLPAHWGTLYELTKLPDDKFAGGEIHREMQRKDGGPFSFPRRGRLCWRPAGNSTRERLAPIGFIVWQGGSILTFAFLTFFAGYQHTWWNWVIAVPSHC